MQGPITKRNLILPSSGETAYAHGPHGGVEPPCSPEAELQPVFAGTFHVVAASGTSTFTTVQVMAVMMVAMSPAFRVCARLQVAHWNFLRLLFAHITFLH